MPFPKRINTVHQINTWKDILLLACGHLNQRNEICPHLEDVISDYDASCAIDKITQVIDDFKTLELKLIQIEKLVKLDME